MEATIAASVSAVSLAIAMIYTVSSLVRLVRRLSENGLDVDELRDELRRELDRGKDAIRKYLDRRGATRSPGVPEDPELPEDPKKAELQFSQRYRAMRHGKG